jgi:hypothetical protein
MEAKEKAEELVGKMCLNDCTDKNIKLAKQCALIAVDGIINFSIKYMQSIPTFELEYKYFIEVKKEIEKL